MTDQLEEGDCKEYYLLRKRRTDRVITTPQKVAPYLVTHPATKGRKHLKERQQPYVSEINLTTKHDKDRTNLGIEPVH
jgi:hypothetical protein